MNIIDNIDITEAMLNAGTSIAEPSASETAWSGSSVSYAEGDIRIRSTTHRKYKCAVAHTSAASPLPENDETRWVDIGPTDRHAPFDIYTNTAATTVTSLTYVIQPGQYFNSIGLFGLTGSQYSVSVLDEPGGTEIFSQSGDLSEDPLGWYEYLFIEPYLKTKIIMKSVPIRPDAEVTIEITAATGAAVGIGMILLGDYAPVFGETSLPAGVTHGAAAEPFTLSYIKTNTDGTTTIVRRHSGTNLRCRAVFPRQNADKAVALLQKVLDRPLAWIASDANGYEGLSTFGLAASSPVSYDSFNNASIDFTIRGII